MTEKRYNVVDLLETLAISVNDECKYYQNSNDDWVNLCKELNRLNKENEELKHKLSQQEMEYATYCNRLAEENEQLKQLVNIADDLIDKLGSETMQNEWIKNF